MIFSQKLTTRYSKLKKEVSECILVMQVGAFMQVMNEDARAVSALTGLKLQMVGDMESPIVLGGFPKSGLDKYVGKLVRAGHSVAIAFQDEKKERHGLRFGHLFYRRDSFFVIPTKEESVLRGRDSSFVGMTSKNGLQLSFREVPHEESTSSRFRELTCP